MDCRGCVCFKCIQRSKLNAGEKVPEKISTTCVSLFEGRIYYVDPDKCPCTSCIIKVVCDNPCEQYLHFNTGHLVSPDLTIT